MLSDSEESVITTGLNVNETDTIILSTTPNTFYEIENTIEEINFEYQLTILKFKLVLQELMMHFFKKELEFYKQFHSSLMLGTPYFL